MESKLLLFLLGLFVVSLDVEARASGGYSGEGKRVDRPKDELPDYLFDVKFDEYPVSNAHLSYSLREECEIVLFEKLPRGAKTIISFL